MESSQTAGVAPLKPGSGATHATPSVLLHWTGNPFSVVEPFKYGPRHWGQFSARSGAATIAAAPR